MAKKVTVTWTDPSPTTGIDHLEIWRKTGVGGTYAQIGGDISLAAANTYEDTNSGAGLTDSTTYYYQVRAYAADGTTYEEVEGNITISAVTIAAPTSLAVGTPTDTTIPLTWTKSTTGVMTAYRVYDDGVLLQTFTGDVAAGTLTGLTASTTYTNLTVRAYNGTSESADSNAVNGTTAAAGGLVFTLTNWVKNSDIEYILPAHDPVYSYSSIGVSTTAILTGDFTFTTVLGSSIQSSNLQIGFDPANASTNYTTWDFGIWANSSSFHKIIAGATSATGVSTIYDASAVLKLERIGTSLKAYINTTLIYDFGTVSTADWYLYFSGSNSSTTDTGYFYTPILT